jgi:large subunit ribosomal protein L6
MKAQDKILTKSRIGKRPIALPDNVELKIENNYVSVKGKLGELKRKVNKAVSIEVDQENKEINVNLNQNDKEGKALHGLWRSLLSNMVHGVAFGFEKTLALVGVGYRAAVAGSKLTLNVGYSNPVEFNVPKDLNVEVQNQTEINIKGIDKDLIGVTASKIRAIRPPEPYKQKGIRYKDEYVAKKEGKTGAK